MIETLKTRRRTPLHTRTCVGCARRDVACARSKLVRAVAGPGGIEFDLAGRAGGRGAYVHAEPQCLGRAWYGLARELSLPPGDSNVGVVAVTRSLRGACDRRIASLVRVARRNRSACIGLPESPPQIEHDSLAIVATDARLAATHPRVREAVIRGRAFAWGTQKQLGALFCVPEATVVAVSLASVVDEILRARAAADAASAALLRAPQRTRSPEGR